MERNIMGELNVYRGSGARPNIREIARRHDMDRHTVAKYCRNGRLGAAAGRGQKDNRIGPRACGQDRGGIGYQPCSRF